MKRCVITLLVLAVSLPCATFELRHPDPVAQAGIEQLRELRREISLVNLLNGLYLSADQVDALIALAEEAALVRERHVEAVAGDGEAYADELSRFLDALYGPYGASDEDKRRAFEWERRVELEPRDRAAEEIGRIEDRARGVLSHAQIAIIEGFKPCLVPPKNLADPVAVGQASTTDREEQLMDLLRRMPEELYQGRRQTIAETIVRRGEREKGATPGDVHAAMVQSYLAKMDEVRALTDVDYQLQKAELARDFRLFDDDVTYRHGRTRELGKVAHLLLHRQAALVLARWRDTRSGGPRQSQPAVPQGPDPAAQQLRREARGVRRYHSLIRRLLDERDASGDLGSREADQLRQDMQAAMALGAPEQSFMALAGVARDLQQLQVTRLAVESQLATVRGLCHVNRVPGVLPPPHGRRRPTPDLTGLGEMVRAAHLDLERGQIEAAHATLAEVIGHLEAFSGSDGTRL